ncbi:LPXTG cell wall anchor domain-containing protein, partial [Gordonibacter sp.]|uniref:LPXTG cell wall anchor domain-containing protein n=1 Tax=Gordonibacter sp. TaxID=1968902 RepID=UPI002FC8C091
EKLDEGGSSGSVTGGTALNTSTSVLAKTGDPLTGITTAIVATLALGAVGFVGYRTRKSAKK